MIEEIAQEMGKTIEEIDQILYCQEQVVVITETCHSEEYEIPIFEMIPDEESLEPLDWMQNAIIKQYISLWLSKLNEKNRLVIQKRFGFDGNEPATLRDIGKEMGLTRECVRQIELRSLEYLHKIIIHSGISKDVLLNK